MNSYIATELCKCTLEFVLTDHQNSINYEAKREILLQATRGLDYLHHRKRIVHRDIKPENIFITDDYCFTVQPRIKLADFGSSIHLKDGQNDFLNDNPDKYNPCWGTNGWMAPELYKEGRCNSKMDIFSMGLVFAYTLSIGRNHAFGENDWEGQMNIIHGKPMTLVEQNLDIQDLFARNRSFKLIEDMVRMEPDHRLTIDQVLVRI